MEKSTSQIEKNVSASFGYVKKDMLMLNDAFSDMHDKIQHLSLNHATLLAEVERLRAQIAGKKKVVKKTVKKKDDLTKIEGIGPAISKLLVKNKITNFKKLSETKTDKLKEILGTKFQMHNPATWDKQAKLASQEKWEELGKLQAKLNGGIVVKKVSTKKPSKKPTVKKVVKETVTYE
jgi:predicted flap endonuclease-1-like 5' DNA nuclease